MKKIKQGEVLVSKKVREGLEGSFSEKVSEKITFELSHED